MSMDTQKEKGWGREGITLFRGSKEHIIERILAEDCLSFPLLGRPFPVSVSFSIPFYPILY